MADSELSRTHPLTVAVRSAATLGQGIAAFVAFAFFGAFSGAGFAFLGIAGLVLLTTLIVSGFSWLAWLYFRFGIVGNDLVIEEGWLIKKRRSIPLARVQGVDIRAGIVSRVLGLADVMVQTAGGGDSAAEARIGSIPLGDAERLRARLIGRVPSQPASAAGSVETAPSEAAGGFIGADPVGHMSDLRGAFGGPMHAELEPVFELKVPVSRLVLAGLTSNGPLIAVGASLGLAVQLYEIVGIGRLDQTASALGRLAIPALLALGLGAFVIVGGFAVAITIARDFGFTIRRTGDRLETEAGLFERRMTSVPVRRIQAIVIESSPLRRLFGLASITVDTAGFGRTDEQQAEGTSAALVPLARSGEVRLLLHSLLWEAEDFAQIRALPRRALRFYVLIPAVLSALITLVVTAAGLRLLAQATQFDGVVATAPLIVAAAVVVVTGIVAASKALAWRASGFGVDADAIVVRWGALGIYRARLARVRIQSISVRQNPFQHHAGLATLAVASVSGSSERVFSVRNLDIADAARIQEWYSPDRVPPGNHDGSDS